MFRIIHLNIVATDKIKSKFDKDDNEPTIINVATSLSWWDYYWLARLLNFKRPLLSVKYTCVGNVDAYKYLGSDLGFRVQ